MITTARRLYFAIGALAALGTSAIAQTGQAQSQMTADVVYAKRGELELKADVYQPRSKGPKPGVLVVHGGAWRLGSKNQLALVASHLANQGFTAVAINYRLAPDHKFPAQFEDCQAAVRWMRTNAEKYEIDPKKIGGFGYSAGGHLVALLAVNPPAGGPPAEKTEKTAPLPSDRLQAAVCGGAPCDFQSLPADSPIMSYWLGGTRSEKASLYAQASPLGQVTKDAPPMFFFHGQHDALVDPRQPEAMVEALKKAGVTTCELHIVPKAGHIEAAMNLKAIGEATTFLKARLK